MGNGEELYMDDHSYIAPLDRNGGEPIGRGEFLTLIMAASFLTRDGFAQTAEDTRARFRKMSEEGERRGLADTFKGISTDGKVAEGLFRSN